MNFIQDTKVSEEVLLDDDDTLIVSTKNDKLKAISLETATVVAEFEGFLALSYEVRAINGGKGQQHKAMMIELPFYPVAHLKRRVM